MNKRRISTAIVGLTSLALHRHRMQRRRQRRGNHRVGGGSSVLTIGMPNGPQTDNSNPFANRLLGDVAGLRVRDLRAPGPGQHGASVRGPHDAVARRASGSGTRTTRRLTLTARDGVKWSDGEDFTAEDIAYSFQIRKDNEGLNTFALPFGDIAVDGNKVTVSFTAGQFVKQGKMLQLFIVPEHVWEDVEDPTTWTNDEPVGTGPYTLKSWTPQAATLTARTTTGAASRRSRSCATARTTTTTRLTTALATGEAQWGWTFIPDFENGLHRQGPRGNNQCGARGPRRRRALPEQRDQAVRRRRRSARPATWCVDRTGDLATAAYWRLPAP